jgi:hypothetical protein
MIEIILIGCAIGLQSIVMLAFYYKLTKCEEMVIYIHTNMFSIYNRRKATNLVNECNLYLNIFEKKYIEYFNKIYTKVDERKYMNTNKVLVMNDPKFYNMECYKYSSIIKRYFPKRVIKVINENNTYVEYILPFTLIDTQNVIRIVETTELEDFLKALKKLYVKFGENNV